MDEQENMQQSENLDGPIQEDKLQNENLDRTIQEDSLQNEKTIRGLAIAATVTFAWILIWALVLKLGSEIMLVRNYYNLRYMTLEERILWDVIPFHYRGEGEYVMRQVLNTILNCFVLAPFGITLCYVFKKPNVWLSAALCFGFALCIEILQLFTVVGNPASEDLITNTASCFIGYAIYHFFLRRMTSKQTSRFLVISNVVLGIGVIFSLVTIAIASDTIFKILTRTL
jgi:glycopeptide antibiotics resistance protein